MLVARRKDCPDKGRRVATQARDPPPHYEHSKLRYNYRTSNLLAAVGPGQLRVLDARMEKRRANFEFYHWALADAPGIPFAPEHPRGRCTRWLTCITVDPQEFGAGREEIRLALEAENIESRALRKPMHLQPIYAGCRARGGSVSQELFANGLCLPSGSNLTDDDLMRIVENHSVHGEAPRAGRVRGQTGDGSGRG
jgi:pyridoxal phosphate-dependent aminotransferase EpsN